MTNDLVCPYCNFDNYDYTVDEMLVGDNLLECQDCGNFFELEDELSPKQIKTKPNHKKFENLEDGF